jgi:acetyltransferase EpsM
LTAALDPSTRVRLEGTVSPYGDGHSAERIATILATWTPPKPPRKAPIEIGSTGSYAAQLDRELILIGGGEHAGVVADAAERSGWTIAGYLDVQRTTNMDLHGSPWLGDDSVAAQVADGRCGVVAVGATPGSVRRQEVVARYEATPMTWATVVDPSATVSRSATLEPGAVVLARATVNSGARIGAHAIVNTGAVVEHDVDLGPFAHAAPGAVIGGATVIGEGAVIGLGARVRDHMTVGRRSVIGMGSVAVHSVADGQTVVGAPAREISAETVSTASGTTA